MQICRPDPFTEKRSRIIVVFSTNVNSESVTLSSMKNTLTTSALKLWFLKYELSLLTFRGALSTRHVEWPIYGRAIKQHQRADLRKAFRKVLVEVETRYARNALSEKEHLAFISHTCDTLSQTFGSDLYRGRLRFGIGQKLINLHLKYLWVAGLSAEPPHCPIDGIVRDQACLEYDWISNDSIQDYKTAIATIRKKADSESLAVWELRNFRRPSDSGISLI